MTFIRELNTHLQFQGPLVTECLNMPLSFGTVTDTEISLLDSCKEDPFVSSAIISRSR